MQKMLCNLQRVRCVRYYEHRACVPGTHPNNLEQSGRRLYPKLNDRVSPHIKRILLLHPPPLLLMV